MKKLLIVLCVSLLLIGSLVGSAEAYSGELTATFYLDGVDLDLGKVHKIPNTLLIVYGKNNEIEKILKPDNYLSKFDSSVDIHFEFDFTEGLPVLVSHEANIDGIIKLTNIPFEDVDVTKLLGDFDPVADIHVDIGDVVVLKVDEQHFFKLRVLDFASIPILPLGQESWDWPITFEVVEVIIPEPSTLLFLGLGLLGLVGIGRWRKKLKGMKKFLLLIVIVGGLLLGSAEPVAAQFFVDSGQTLGDSPSWAVALGDVDGDGDLDAFVTNNDDNRVWLNQGGTQGGTPGIFLDSGQSLGSAPRSYDVALGDVDGDGDLDAFVANNVANRVWLNQGGTQGGTPGIFLDSGQALGNATSTGVALGDVDGDGDLDAFVTNTGANRVWLNNGAGNFNDSLQTLGSASSLGVALGDVDGDGDLDAFVANSSYQANRAWLNQGGVQGGTPGIFLGNGQTLGNASSHDVALGDVDGDGDLDAYVANYSDNSLWLNDGSGNFSDSGQSLGSVPSDEVALGDVDGDGDLDAFIVNYNYNASSVWLNQGGVQGGTLGTFFDSGQTLGGTDFSYGVALGDVDGDGDLDAFVANDGPTNVNRVWLNVESFCETVTEIPQAECEALVALYDSTDGTNWTDHSGWKQNNTPCDYWNGVSCADGHVQELQLNANGLNGTIPPEIGDLLNLRYLYLHENSQLIGGIPPEIGNLTASLDEINLSNTQLSGSVPPELGNIARLDVLNLSNTELSGALPANLTNTNLRWFYFNGTNLCEPPDATFQNWLISVANRGGWTGTGVDCPVVDYFVYDEYGGAWHDANATGAPAGPEDDDLSDGNMCWAFTSSNILEWAGWDLDPPRDTADGIAADYKNNWTNVGGMMKYAWNWWIDGTPPPAGVEWSQLEPNPDGSYWPTYSFVDHYVASWKTNIMAAVKDYLHSGHGVTLRLYDQAKSTDTVGHALTVWGYQAYEDGTVIGLHVTDAADAADLQLLPVTYTANPDVQGDLKWRFVYAPYEGWLIEGVQSLKQREPNFVRVRKAGTGTGTVTGGYEIDCGEACVETYSDTDPPVILTATPTVDTPSTFVGWAGACSGATGNTCTLTIGGEKNVIAIFGTAPSSENFQVIINAETGATFYPIGDVQQIPAGASATYIFAADDQYQIVDVLVDGKTVGPVSEYTFPDIAANHTIEIETLEKDAKLAVVTKKCMDINNPTQEINCPPGKNGTIIIGKGDQQCDAECMKIMAEFAKGEGVMIQVVPDEGSKFAGWELGNGETLGPDEKIYYTEEDLILRPVIRCTGW